MVWDGETVPFEIETVKLVKDGFEIRLTKPARTEGLGVSGHSWYYPYGPGYGAPQMDGRPLKVAGVELEEGGTVVRVRLERAFSEAARWR
ncbi:MAG: hypothetical protein AAGA67_14530 [Cyanobacteria bacterium P01_F01_bin.153]